MSEIMNPRTLEAMRTQWLMNPRTLEAMRTQWLMNPRTLEAMRTQGLMNPRTLEAMRTQGFSRSLLAQRNGRIKSRRASRGQPRRDYGDDQEEGRHRCESYRVCGFDVY